MSASAQVTSLDAVVRFKSALVKFGAEAADALAALGLEVQRAVEWLEHDRPAYWQDQVRRGWDKVAEARSNLERCEMMVVAGHVPACRDEKAALDKAKRDLRRAEEKVELVRKWIRTVRHETTEYGARMGQIAGWLETDLPKSLGLLERMLLTLESYTAMTTPQSASAEDIASMARDGTMAVEPQDEHPDTETGTDTEEGQSTKDEPPRSQAPPGNALPRGSAST